MIKYSVIIPIYNAEKYLEECIFSILNQNRNDVELVLVNDGSTDNSLEICNKFKENYNNIILINKENTGSMDSWIIGVRRSNGQYICFIDADDKFEFDFFESIDKYVDLEYDIVMYDFYRMFKNQVVKEKVNNIHYGEISNKELDGIKYDYFGNFEKYSFYRWDKVIKADIIKSNIKKISQRTVYMEDHPIGLLNLLNSNKIYYIDKCLYYYRMRKSSVTHKFSEKVLKDYAVIEKEITKFAKEYEYSDISIYNMHLYFMFQNARGLLKLKKRNKEINVKFKDIIYTKQKSQKLVLLFYKFHLSILYTFINKIKNQKKSNEYFD